MTNNLYTLYFQNWYDTMINLDISIFFNNTENYYRMKMGHMIYSYFPSVENSWNWLQEDCLEIVITF